jgi:hypothetical protein
MEHNELDRRVAEVMLSEIFRPEVLVRIVDKMQPFLPSSCITDALDVIAEVPRYTIDHDTDRTRVKLFVHSRQWSSVCTVQEELSNTKRLCIAICRVYLAMKMDNCKG